MERTSILGNRANSENLFFINAVILSTAYFYEMDKKLCFFSFPVDLNYTKIQTQMYPIQVLPLNNNIKKYNLNPYLFLYSMYPSY